MKPIAISLLIAAAILYGASYLTSNKDSVFKTEELGRAPSASQGQGSNVAIINGKQVITVDVRGGYSPQISVAKSGIPTEIRFKTNNTFDCSSSIRIPSLSVSKSLPSTGETVVDIGSQKIGTLQGSCSMGMYNFSVKFEG